MYVYWPGERFTCGHRGKLGRCNALIAFDIVRSELYDEGPQGSSVCARNHVRWIWPRECRVAEDEDAARQALRPLKRSRSSVETEEEVTGAPGRGKPGPSVRPRFVTIPPNTLEVGDIITIELTAPWRTHQ